MNKFVGTKVVLARPMTRQEYNDYRGWKLPEYEDGSDAGYLVEYVGGGEPNHPDHNGYISWSPERVFITSYQDTTEGISFGAAIKLMKAGLRLARKGWNGKGMFAYYVSEGAYPAQSEAIKGAFPNDTVPYRSYIAMTTAQHDVVPWVASQSDILANDWVVVPTNG